MNNKDINIHKKITTFDEWKKQSNKTEKKTLPSGVVIEIRELDLIEEAALGHISMELINEVMDQNTKKKVEMTSESLKNMMKLVNKIVVLAVVDPKIVEKNVEEIPVKDRMCIFNYINQVPGSSDFAPFRQK